MSRLNEVLYLPGSTIMALSISYFLGVFEVPCFFYSDSFFRFSYCILCGGPVDGCQSNWLT